MSFISSDTKGDIYRSYGNIARKYYGYNISVLDLRNPTKSHGNNLLHLVNGECFFTFQMSDEFSRNPIPVNKDAIGEPAKIGERVNYQGIPYYLEQMNEWVREYASIFNGLYGVDGATDYDGNDRSKEIFFTGDDEVNSSQFKLTVDRDAKHYSSIDDGYYQLTAGNFNVRKTLEDNPRTMATHTVYTDGESKYDIVENLIDLSSNINKMKFRGCIAERSEKKKRTIRIFF